MSSETLADRFWFPEVSPHDQEFFLEGHRGRFVFEVWSRSLERPFHVMAERPESVTIIHHEGDEQVRISQPHGHTAFSLSTARKVTRSLGVPGDSGNKLALQTICGDVAGFLREMMRKRPVRSADE